MIFRELTVVEEKCYRRSHECGPYEHYYAHGGNEWLEQTGSQPAMDRGRRWIAAGDGLRPEMDSGRKWIAAGNGLRPEMLNMRWILSGGGSRPDMDRDRIWMDDRRWMTGYGSQEMDHGRRMTINLLSNMQLRSCNRAQICRETVFQRHGSTEYDAKHYSEHHSEHYSEIPNHARTCPSSNAEYDPESDPELQQQCQYRTSLTRLILGGATIFKVRDESAGFATTLTTNNYHTGSAGTKH